MIDPFEKVSVQQHPNNQPDSTTDSADLSTATKCDQAMEPNETGTMNPSETRPMNPQYSKTGFGKEKLPNYPDTPEKVKQFIEDYAIMDKQALIERYAPNWSTLKTWAHRLGAKRGEQFQVHHNGGRLSNNDMKVKSDGTELVEKIEAIRELDADPEIQSLVKELVEKLRNIKSTADVSSIQPLILKLQGLAAMKGARNISELVEELRGMYNQFLQTRVIDSKSPIKISKRYQYEQAMGYWVGMVRDVASEQEWLILKMIMQTLSVRSSKKGGAVVNEQDEKLAEQGDVLLRAMRMALVEAITSNGTTIADLKLPPDEQKVVATIILPQRKASTTPVVIGQPDLSFNTNIVAQAPSDGHSQELAEPQNQNKNGNGEKCPATSRFETPSQFKPENRMYVPGLNPKVLQKGIDNPTQRLLLGAGLEDISQVPSLYKNQLKKIQEQTKHEHEPASEPKRQEVVSNEQLSGIGRKDTVTYKPYRPG